MLRDGRRIWGVLMLARVLVASPLSLVLRDDKGGGFPADSPTHESFWVKLAVSVVLVLLGGVFAGLTLGLMGQDEITLQVLEASGDDTEKYHAMRVLRLLKNGKHWVLVTLLLSNVVVNESLPIVFDSVLGGGWPAVLISSALIVIFGEVIPQSVCVRYGLSIGSYLAPFVLVLMYILYPVAYPVAKLLDKALGEDHGTIYKKAGLKTLVSLHGTFGIERLNEDEVTIISAVLDLKDKPVGAIMTPINDVFTMSADRIMNEETMDEILNEGYSRIPIHAPGKPTDFYGMLLVKILITYDPEDGRPVSSFPLATLPETKPSTSCLDILNFFQEGRSHMVLVSSQPGEDYGALGVLTLEDVIEELIGEEIVDETDVYVDVHRHLRRLHPSAPALRKISSKLSSTDPAQKRGIAGTGLLSGSAPGAGAASGFKPSNLAQEPRVTTNTKVTIKLGQLNNSSSEVSAKKVDSNGVYVVDEAGLTGSNARLVVPGEAANNEWQTDYNQANDQERTVKVIVEGANESDHSESETSSLLGLRNGHDRR